MAISSFVFSPTHHKKIINRPSPGGHWSKRRITLKVDGQHQPTTIQRKKKYKNNLKLWRLTNLEPFKHDGHHQSGHDKMKIRLIIWYWDTWIKQMVNGFNWWRRIYWWWFISEYEKKIIETCQWRWYRQKRIIYINLGVHYQHYHHHHHHDHHFGHVKLLLSFFLLFWHEFDCCDDHLLTHT